MNGYDLEIREIFALTVIDNLEEPIDTSPVLP
jgi:hypothetical protein